MRYYAVTNDPNELMHFGIKGMKWGIIRTDAQLGHPRHSGSRRPRSAAYKKASAKLSRSMRNGIEKVETKWKEHNSPEAKEDRFMKKALQKARNGTLKYGKLSDDQVRRVTERLALEQDARRLGNTEKRRYVGRLRTAIGEGIVTGVGKGIGNRVEEWISRGGEIKTQRLLAEDKDRLDARKEKRRIKNARKEAEEKSDREFREKVRNAEFDDEREANKVRNVYEYGASYDKDGKLDFTDRKAIENYYDNRYLKNETRTHSRQRQEREAAAHIKEAERQKRLEASREEKERQKERKRLEEAKKKEQLAKEAEEKAKYHARYSEGWNSLLNEAKSREVADAWESKKSRIRDAKEKERYQSNVSKLSEDSRGKHSKVGAGWRRISAMDEEPIYTPIHRVRKRPGRGNRR